MWSPKHALDSLCAIAILIRILASLALSGPSVWESPLRTVSPFSPLLHPHTLLLLPLSLHSLLSLSPPMEEYQTKIGEERGMVRRGEEEEQGVEEQEGKVAKES